MKRILYLNYMKQYGHLNFDQIHIDALLAEGNDVRLVMPEKMAKLMNRPCDMYEWIIPNWMSYYGKNGAVNRLFYILILLVLRIRTRFSKYDVCVVSNTDEISLGLVPFPIKEYLICHANCCSFANKLKRYFMNKLSASNDFIVFNERMKQVFVDNGINNVHIVSHGCMPSFDKATMTSIPQELAGHKHIVFHPSSKPERKLLAGIMGNKRLHKYLIDNDVVLVLRNKPDGIADIPNIVYINRYLTTDEYRGLFLKSDVILLAYPEEFAYSVSGVSFECVSNSKNVLVLENPSLDYCRKFYSYDPFFKDTDDFCDKLNSIISNPDDNRCIVEIDELRPNYNKVFQNKA